MCFILKAIIIVVLPQMSENSLEAKQIYLRQNIISAGYDPEAFVDFCSQTHDLDDLQNWTMEQLVTIVQKYIKSVKNNHKGENKHEEEQFAEYQEPQHAKKQPEIAHSIPAQQQNFTLQFTDDDWKSFLSAPSIASSNGNHQTMGIFDLPHDLLLGQSTSDSNKKHKQGEKTKEGPLSPPSIMTTKTQQTKTDPVAQHKPSLKKQKQKQQQKAPGLSPGLDKQISPRLEKQKESKQQTAINLSNIKINTAKSKLQPLLPVINDVVVTNTEQVSRNFLQSDYTLYHISFPPTKHVVKRKFADLRKVRHILQKFYPFLRLPYLEGEGWIGSSEGRDPQTLQKYKWMVEEFLNYVLLKSKQLKDNELVRILCGFSLNGQKDDLKKKIQAFQTAPRPKCINQVVLTQNNITIPPVCVNEKLISNTTGLLSQLQIQYQRLRKQIDNLFSTYDLLTKNYNEIINTFQTLQSLTKKYNFENDDNTEFRIFEGLREMTTKLGNRVNQQYGMYRDRIKGLFRYEKDNMHTLKEVFDMRSKVHNEYIRQGNPQFTSNSMRMQGSTVEIESAIPIEQPIRNNKNMLALQQAFWAFSAKRQVQRYWQHLRRKVNQHLTLIAYDQLDKENQNLNFWNTVIKKCVI